MKYSVIVPVFNRPQEVEELLESLALQSFKDFELVLIEDGSSERCDHIVQRYAERLVIQYYYKTNTGPGDSRNVGMERARGDYFLFFDSDCVIPPQYFEVLDKSLTERPLDCFGGPDNAHESFSDVQKAINYSMTSFFTTGGIRGRKKQLDKYQPRSFNMGFRREVYEKVGGFGTIHPGEDPDLSYRILKAGFSVGLVADAFVYHKRRIDFEKFWQQVYKFGVVRVILMKWHPESQKLVYWLPTAFLLGTAFLLLLTVAVSGFFFVFLIAYCLLIFIDALNQKLSPAIAGMAIFASFIQLFGYGYGFLKAYIKINLQGQDERKAFPKCFFEKR